LETQKCRAGQAETRLQISGQTNQTTRSFTMEERMHLFCGHMSTKLFACSHSPLYWGRIPVGTIYQLHVWPSNFIPYIVLIWRIFQEWLRFKVAICHFGFLSECILLSIRINMPIETVCAPVCRLVRCCLGAISLGRCLAVCRTCITSTAENFDNARPRGESECQPAKDGLSKTPNRLLDAPLPAE